MRVKRKNLENSFVELLIELEKSDLEAKRKEAIANIGKNLKVKGFRIGKVPLNIVPNFVSQEKINYEIIELAIPFYYLEAIKKENLLVLTKPEMRLDTVNFPEEKEGQPALSFFVRIGVAEVKKLADLKNWKERFCREKIKNEEVQRFLEDQRMKFAEFKEKHSEAKDGDRIEINFEGKINGIIQEKLTSRNYPVVLGKGFLIPDFEKNLIGLKKGDKKSFNLKFSKDYYVKEFAGKTVDFEVSVNTVWDVLLPELDDKFVSKISKNKFSKLDEYKKEVKNYLQREKDNLNYDALTRKFQDFLLENSEVIYPKEYLESEIKRKLGMLEHDLSHSNLTLKEYAKRIRKTVDDLKKEIEETTRKEINLGFIINEIIKVENITLSKDEEESFKKYFKEQKKNFTDEELSDFKSRVLIEKVYEKFLGSVYENQEKDS